MDEMLGEVPIYLYATARSPHDDTDEPANFALTVCMNDYIHGQYGESALLIWRGPVYMKIRRKYYCSIGMMLFDDEWLEILINKDCFSPGITYELNCELERIDTGHPALVDEDKFLLEGIVGHVAGVDDSDAPDEGWQNFTTKSPSGWNQVMLLNSDYGVDDS